MSLMMSGHHGQAERIAREILKKTLDVGDIAWTVEESIKDDAVHDELCTALDSEYPAIKKRLSELDDQIDALPTDKVKELFSEWQELCRKQDFAKQLAYFHLGFAAALRLGRNP